MENCNYSFETEAEHQHSIDPIIPDSTREIVEITDDHPDFQPVNDGVVDIDY